MKTKEFIIVALISLLAWSCSDTKGAKYNKEDLANKELELGDYIQSLRSNNEDSITMQKAQTLVNELIAHDSENKVRHYTAKSHLLAIKGEYRKAFLLQDSIIPQDANDYERILFTAVKHQSEGEMEQANELFERAMAICDTNLEDSVQNTWIAQKTHIYFYRNQKDSARQVVEAALAKKPNDRMLEMMVKNMDRLYESNQRHIADLKQ